MGHTTTSLSEALGFGRSYINSVTHGQFLPSAKRCRMIAEYFGDDPNVILSLAGYYEPPPDDPVITSIVQVANSLSPELRRDLLDYARFLKTKQ